MISKNMHYLLLCSCFGLSAGTVYAQGDCTKRMAINHNLIDILDGTPRLDLIKVLKLENNIKKLKSDMRSRSFSDVVSDIITVATDYLNQAGASRDQFFDIIRQWAEQRQCINSLLCRQWCAQVEGDERAFLRSLLTSFHDIEQFLSDLDCFLKDFRHSCPKSSEQVKKALEEIRSRRSRGAL